MTPGQKPVSSERTGREWRRRLVFLASLNAAVCALACLVDVFIATAYGELRLVGRGLALLGASGVGAIAGGAIGVLETGALFTLDKVLSPLDVRRRWQAAFSSAPERREAVVSFHAWALGIALFSVLAVAGFGLFYLASERIKEPALKVQLTILSAAVAVLLPVILAATMLPLSKRLMLWLDRRSWLPLPRGDASRFFLFVVVPTLLVAVPSFWTFGVKLGIIAHVLGAISLIVVVRFVALLLGLARRTVGLRFPRVFRRSSHAAMGVVVALAASCPIVLQLSDGAAHWVTRGAITPFAVDALQRVSDVDGDGVSSLFGGRDCAAFDGARSPAERDVPDNGIDEDCDGSDARATEGFASVQTFADLDQQSVRRYNVLLYIVDSLRADHLPLYGYGKNTSPTVTRLGKEAWVFENSYSQSSNTSISVPSLMAGQWPGSLNWKRGIYPVVENTGLELPSAFTKQGYYTALLINDWVSHKLPGIQFGFAKTFVAPPEVNWRSGETVLSNAITAINEAVADEKPFFIVAHVDDVHHPYTAHRGHALPDFPNPDKAQSGYDRGIALFDQHLSLAMAHLKNRGLWDDTIVIVTADHGEEFLEHGGTIHSRTCYSESVRVPLVMRVPGYPGKRVNTPVALVDIAPTLLELTGARSALPSLDGQSLLVPLRQPQRVDTERPLFCSIFQMLGGRQNFFIRSVRSGDYALFHEMLSDSVELYDTKSDRGEKQNLASNPAHKERIEDLKKQLRASLTGNLFEARTYQ